MTRQEKRRKAIIKRRIFLSVCAVVLAVFIVLITLLVKSCNKYNKTVNTDSSVTSSATKDKESDLPKNEKVIDTYATVISTGDIMVHSTQLSGARISGSDEYDFSAFFKETAPYLKNYDLAVANLEVTFGGTEAGAYSGYPAFNIPDSLADVIKNAGFNFLVTANNHCYDTGLSGLKRTARVLKDKGIDFIGTKEVESDKTYAVKEINGIKIGIGNYTYESEPENALSGRKYINGNLIKEEANSLINSFAYKRIDEFYAQAEKTITAMKKDGAEFIVFYIHWGNEYKLEANTWQKSIAQKLSNLGVDIIVGSHPHVIEPVEYITSEDGTNSTVCIYSTGNAISNQRQEIMDSCPSGHTEDGMLFTFKIKKHGKDVTLENVDIIPTWVNKYSGTNGYQYTIYPLENANSGSEKYGLNSTAALKSQKSYERTKAIVGEGLTAIQNAIGCPVTFQ